ncbi:MMPL family transporter [Caballeronia insecticola]|uniref:Putative drug efflux pump RND superfamily n=1 Tax=Caballeronia insecticola TaxID=758793 RepID=R4WSC8_9BURK|nr:MMPL family transporter [Caballeronia insecticola]BAN27563.1 putative drug efflux pump RND superfamily [Caballeronia insecticola]
MTPWHWQRTATPCRIRAAWFALALVAVLYCVHRFSGPSPLETNLLALLPATEANPVAEKAVDQLANALGDRTVFLVSSSDADHAKAAARRFGATLKESGAFASVTADLPPFDMAQIGALYTPYRFGLMTRDDRDALAHASDGDQSLRNALMQRVYNPVRGPLATQLADDPFGWLEHWLSDLPLATSNLDLDDNLLVAHRGDMTSVLVVTTLNGSAYESRVQRAVLTATAQAEASLHAAWPDATVARAGAVFYAESARRASEREVHLIGIASACGIALLMMWVFRSPRLLLLGFLSTALGIAGALSVTMAVFGKLHLLTLVFGASLIGEAVDYSIQYFVVYLGAPRDWDAQHGARSVRPALAVALATSLLGYAILAWAPFPALKQIACFAMTGICVAFASVMSLLPAMLPKGPRGPKGPKSTQRRAFARAAVLLTHWQRAIGAKRPWLVAVVIVVVCAPGWLLLTSDDDIHLLIQRDPALVAQENQVRDAVGIDNTAQFFVVQGASPESVLQRAEALGDKLDALPGDQSVDGWRSITQFVPSQKRQSDVHALLAQHVFDHPDSLRATLLQTGFRDDVARAWIDSFARNDTPPLTVERWLATPWSRPFAHLWLGAVEAKGARAYAAIVMPRRVTPSNLPALIATAHAMEGVAFVDKAASVSKLFGEYRLDSAMWLGGALLLVLVLMIARYSLRGGVATTLPVLLAIGVTLAAFGYARVPVNLFNCLALMLVIGVGANYAVFLREGWLRAGADIGAVWTGVLLSAATTLLSFGMLGISAMPALKSFGATLTLGILIAVLLAPMGMPAELPKEGRKHA